MAWSSSGLGHCPLKAKIGGSNPLQATTVIFCEPFEAGHQLGGFAFFVSLFYDRQLRFRNLWAKFDPCLESMLFRVF